jgi:hypothetical protein
VRLKEGLRLGVSLEEKGRASKAPGVRVCVYADLSALYMALSAIGYQQLLST